MSDVSTPFHIQVQPVPRYYVEIKWDGKGLSISSVDRPKSNGDCVGGAGQHLAPLTDHERKSRPGWCPEMRERLADLWERWHLNTMRAGCEHQRAAGWDLRRIDPSKPLIAYGLHFEGQQTASWNMLAWIRPDEHPDGLLNKPCPECGYRYGSAWLTEEVPEDVVEWLRGLPRSDGNPWTHTEDGHVWTKPRTDT